MDDLIGDRPGHSSTRTSVFDENGNREARLTGLLVAHQTNEPGVFQPDGPLSGRQNAVIIDIT